MHPPEATTGTQNAARVQKKDFDTEQVINISFGHFVHDIYSAFLAPLLPLLIDKLSMSLTAAGSLSAIMQIPAVLNPFIGYLADKMSLRYFIILTPAITATLMTIMGIMPNYLSLAILLFVTGISVAAFHAPAPAMVAKSSGSQTGKGMSFLMAGGEMGRTVGPLLAVWAASLWGLEGIWRIAVIGWATSGLLFFRLRGNGAPEQIKQPGLRAALPIVMRVFPPLIAIVFFRSLLQVSLSVYLPTFMLDQGSSLWVAGAALAIWEIAGVAGALLSGPLSDRIGRKPVLIAAVAGAALFMFAFLNIQGWLLVPALLALGLTLLSTQPVLLAIVQDHLPEHRAVANGLYMGSSFLVRTLGTLAVGLIGDHFGLRTAFWVSAVTILLAIPAVLWLPSVKNQSSI